MVFRKDIKRRPPLAQFSSYLQFMDVHSRPGRPQHASPVAARRPGFAPHHRSNRDELPGDHGALVDCSFSPSLPRPVDARQSFHR